MKPVSPILSRPLPVGDMRPTIERSVSESVRAVEFSSNYSSKVNGLSYRGAAIGIDLKQKVRQLLKASMRDPSEHFASIYKEADKRIYQKHGLHFEYAVVTRTQFPFLLEIGSPGLCSDGMIFVMEDFFVDLDQELRNRIVEFIAVHEFGEIVFNSHHEGSKLEFSVAQREGFLPKYLEILQDKNFLKFRDIALHRMKEIVQENLEERVRPEARKLKDSFEWPKELREKYDNALDEDEEIARERVKDWMSYITVNEQARGYLNKASDDALNAFKQSIQQGRSVPEALLPAASAFYGALGVFYQEMTEGVLPREFLEDETMRDAVGKVHSALAEGMRQVVDCKPNDEMPLLSRDLNVHLGVLELETRCLELLEIEEGDSEIKGSRDLLWRMIQDIVLSSGTKSEAEAMIAALGMIPEVQKLRKHLHSMKIVLDSDDPQLNAFQLEKEILWRLAHSENQRKLLSRLSDGVLQALVDEAIETIRKESGIVDPIKIEVVRLRQVYRKDLAAYDQPENEPMVIYQRRIEERKREKENELIAKYRDLDDRDNARIIEEIAVSIDKNHINFEAEVSRKVTAGEMPMDLARSVLHYLWENKTISFVYELGGDTDWFTHVIKQDQLSQEELGDLFRYRLLKTRFLQEHSDNAVILDAIAEFPMKHWSSEQATDLAAIAPQVVRETAKDLSTRSRDEMLTDLEESLSTRNVSLSKIQTLETLLSAYKDRHKFYRNAYHLRRKAEKLPKNSLSNFLRLISLQDWVSLEAALASIENNQRPEMGSLLYSLHQQWREDLRLADSEMGETLVDRDLLVKLALEAQVPLEQVVHNYRYLISVTDPHLKELLAKFTNVPTDSNITGPAFDVFLGCGEPLLEDAARQAQRELNEKEQTAHNEAKIEEANRLFDENKCSEAFRIHQQLGYVPGMISVAAFSNESENIIINYLEAARQMDSAAMQIAVESLIRELLESKVYSRAFIFCKFIKDASGMAAIACHVKNNDKAIIYLQAALEMNKFAITVGLIEMLIEEKNFQRAEMVAKASENSDWIKRVETVKAKEKKKKK